MPIHYGFTNTKLPSDLNKKVSKSSVNLKSDVVTHQPVFFSVLKEFDELEKAKGKKYEVVISFLKKKVLK